MEIAQQLMVVLMLVVIYPGSTSGAKCPSGYKDCDKIKSNGCETAIASDVNNCGKCGVICPTPPYPSTEPRCSRKRCGFQCASMYGNCNHDLTDGCESFLVADVNNCGRCGNKCPPPTFFIKGEAYCRKGGCQERCKFTQTYDGNKKRCVP